MVKLAEVASDCHSMAVSTRTSLASATREFLARDSRAPTNPAIGYYARYSALKNWDATDGLLLPESRPSIRAICFNRT